MPDAKSNSDTERLPMGGLKAPEWRRLPVSLSELCINTTLRCGQSFRWRKTADDEWSCAFHGRILTLRQDSTHLHFKATFPKPSRQKKIRAPPTPPASPHPSVASVEADDDTERLVRHYFNLIPNLTNLYEQWSAADANFRKRAPKFTGVRILQQDAWEALVGFICSSNNNIARISQMVHKLCVHYGPLIGHVDSEPYHDFPTPLALAKPHVEQHLRELGFGYRAKYLYKTAVMISELDDTWLDDLRNPENPVLGVEPRPAGEMLEGGRQGYRDAHEALLKLQGVGPKVADCVALMGLGWGEAVPVDTHVWQIAQRDYKFGRGKHSSLTKATYDAVGNCFRRLWGKEAGWAHSVLFTADLRAFSDRLHEKIEKGEVVIKPQEEVIVKSEAIDMMAEVAPLVSEGKIPARRVKIERDLKRALDETLKNEPGDDMMTTVKRRRRSGRT